MDNNKISALVLLAALGVGFFGCLLHKDGTISLSERRRLAQKPSVSVESLVSGKFADDFESYALDQFPLRDGFRSIKAVVQYDILRQRDNNGVYIVGGSLSKLETTLNEDSVASVADKLSALRAQYFPDSAVYYGVIPDKNYFLAEANGYPHLDYEKMGTILAEGLPDWQVVTLTDCLGVEDYYQTDSHWRQERLAAVTQRIGDTLGVAVAPFSDYRAETYDNFRGVYWGQSALPLKAEGLTYLTSDLLESCSVYHFETSTETGIYEPERLTGTDPYDVFLGGADALLTITNPNATTERELIMFRDSFGSSLAPLLVQDYKTVTLVDLRYISSQILGDFIDFHGQDVLFLYSPSVYNQSALLK
jgi:hypothetical protein